MFIPNIGGVKSDYKLIEADMEVWTVEDELGDRYELPDNQCLIKEVK